jgi:hypothetical protein
VPAPVKIVGFSEWPQSAAVFVPHANPLHPNKATTVTLHITQFDGGNALSAFRVQQILPRLMAVHDRINGLFARHVHLVGSVDTALRR